MGWSYVLSARLVELRKMTEEDVTSYTQNTAPTYIKSQYPPETQHLIDVGNADRREIRWWAAVLAKGPGWKATLVRSETEFSPQWACHLDDDETVAILHDKPTRDSEDLQSNPPTSIEAQDYLVKFARLHDAFDQLIAAFSAILTVPVRYGAPVRLPRPQAMAGVRRDTELKYSNKAPSPEELPRFMFLSAVGHHLAINGTFWEPGVPCTLLSEWMYAPLREVLPQLLEQKEHTMLVNMMATRRPTIASLWLGSLITGSLPRLLRVLLHWPSTPWLHYTVWTGCHNSYMNAILFATPRVCRNYKGEKVISRDHEVWLFYIANAEPRRYGLPPIEAYSPFSYVKLRDTAPEVQLHVSCGHRLQYSHWVWQKPGILDEPVADDFGPSGFENIPLQRQPKTDSVFRRICEKIWVALLANFQQLPVGEFEETRSETATRGFHQWIFYNSGVKPGEEIMYRHDWLKLLLDDSDDESSSVPNSSDTVLEK